MNPDHLSDLFDILTDRIILYLPDNGLRIEEPRMVGFDGLRSSKANGCPP
jgi:hypothetical protein